MIYEIARMTHDEVAARLDEGVDTVILPLGTTESHGYHCPLNMDSISVDVVARRAADKLNCFYAPLMPYGMSTSHMAFKGTMTLSPMTMAAVVKELIESLVHRGFRNIIVMTAHGGNGALLNATIIRLSGLKATISAVTYWQLIVDELRAIGESKLGGMGMPARWRLRWNCTSGRNWWLKS